VAGVEIKKRSDGVTDTQSSLATTQQPALSTTHDHDRVLDAHTALRRETTHRPSLCGDPSAFTSASTAVARSGKRASHATSRPRDMLSVELRRGRFQMLDANLNTQLQHVLHSQH
jgi:hypothetical protein